MVRSAMRRTPQSPARAVVVAKPSATRTPRVTTAEAERHAAARTSGPAPVLANLSGQRRADSRDGDRGLRGADRLSGDPEVAHKNSAGPSALVEPVRTVPPDES